MSRNFDRWVQNMKARESARDERSRLRFVIHRCHRGDFSDFKALKRYDNIHLGYRDRRWMIEQIVEVLGVTREEAERHFAEWKAKANATPPTDRSLDANTENED